MIPISQVSAEQKENHMAQERGKRRQFLQRFFDACAAAKVHIILINKDSMRLCKAMLLRLSEDVVGCMSDSPKAVHFWRIRHEAATFCRVHATKM